MSEKKILLNYSQALDKSEKYCAYQERCQSEVRNKLYEWGLHSKEVENLIAELISNQFINEERFSKAYASGKFRMKQWGRVKIKIELRKRKVSDYCINAALKEIPEEEYRDSLKKLIRKKAGTTKNKNDYIFKNILAAFAVSKGYENSLVWEMVEDFVN